ncbi:MAG: hypothetical protein PUC62_05835 [Oscillospiraceae bacterium]|nr:hypothetical protein [Oscillospiraceae bacterium]
MSTKTREVFSCFLWKNALNIGKYRQNRGWKGHRDRSGPCFLLFGCKMSALLFAFLYGAKKLAKQHPTGFEYENVKSVAEKEKKDFVNQQNLCCNIW